MTKPYRMWEGKRLPEFIKIYADRHGKIRCYVNRGGARLGTIHARPILSERWKAEYYAIMAGRPLAANEDEETLEPGRVRPFSFAALVAEYKRRPQGFDGVAPFCELKPKTVTNYNHIFNKLVALFGDEKVALMTRDVLEDLLGKVSNSRNWWTVLRIVFKLARHLKWRPDNLMTEMGRARLKKGGFDDWSELEFHRYAKHHAGNADAMWTLIGMGYGCGARSGDFCRLGWDDIHTDEDGVRYLTFTPAKTDESTGAEVNIELLDERFLDVLATRPASGYFLPSREGDHWTEAHLRKTFRGWCREANIPDGRKMHGLRKWFACWLLGKGCSEGMVAALLGDTVESIRPYIAAYNRMLAGRDGIRKAAQRKAA